jgi:uncharacterized protein (TIGR03435 family)
MRSRRSLVLAALLPILADAQTQPAFEVASVKPTQHGRNAEGFSHSSVDIPSPGRLVAENSSLDELIRFAYSLKEYQVSGPIWLNDDSESFDVLAKASPDTPKAEMRMMLQGLLRERFKLAAHRESKVLPIYELVVDKRGPRLKAADPAGRHRTSSGGGNMTATKVTMTDFAYELSRDLKRPVLDKTGITGAFDFELHWVQAEDSVSSTTAFLTAIRDTIGLKLQSAKGPVEILVIDHIEKIPTEN